MGKRSQKFNGQFIAKTNFCVRPTFSWSMCGSFASGELVSVNKEIFSFQLCIFFYERRYLSALHFIIHKKI